ncbi:MAG TPA: prolyl oligopeptidase family serine peptidase, partial [Vicinamibacterales bacterium]|nr:prolyl oligopeptidase family serine peptidase [Vicinamibacterales bacterium]
SKEKKPLHRRLSLLNLSTGELSTIEGVESFAFSADGRQLLMRRYAPERAPRTDADPAAAADPEDVPGATTVVRDLTSGRDTTFGNVADAAWQTKGVLLAIAIAAEDRAGNGVQVFDPVSATLRVLDSGSSRYLGLTWRKDADDLAVLKSNADERRDGATYSILAWTGVGTAAERKHQYDPSADRTLGFDRRLVAFRRPVWSDDGAAIFVGVGAWAAKSPAPKKDTDLDAGDPSTVDVWHARDIDVMPKQKIGAVRDRQRSVLAAWSLDRPALTILGRDFYEQVVPLKAHNLAYAVSWTDGALERSWGRFGNATISLVDISTGERRKVADRVDDRRVTASPDGKYILFFADGQISTIDTARRAVVNISRAAPTSFVDRESDSTDVEPPGFGYAGWTKDDRDVLLYDKFDVWQVAADGSNAIRLTDGAAEQIEYRVARVDSETLAFDRSAPLYFSLTGIWSKKSGFARLAPGGAAPERLLWMDKSVARLVKAKDTNVYEYVVQDFDDSPDAFVGGGDLKGAKQVTATNAFQSRFAWGHTELIEYKSERGQRLQGALRYPAGYERGKTYPMIVYVYEKRSDALHQYSAPSEREYYNISSFTSAGYFVLEPDIVFRPREPGLSVIECVKPAVAAVARMGAIDPKRVGIIGHSWGGFDAAFLATHTDIFAAAVAGAPITDLVSNYGSHHFSSGIAETDHIETGQQRMQVPLYEDLAAYTRNSAVFTVNTMTTPLLIEVGDADGTVFWHQGVELYNDARRAKKDVVLLVYGGEDHGLRRKNNQIDYHHRIMDWFGHYLKGEPAQAWITSGVSYLDKEKATRKSGS